MEDVERRGRLLAASLIGWCALWYVAYAWAAIARLDLVHRPAQLAVAITVLAVLWVAAWLRPMPATLLFLIVLPFFGNHPGGRLMELINLPLAATAAGMARQSWHWTRPAPAGPIWIAAALYVASAVVAVVPSIPGMMVQAAQLNHWPTTIMNALTASEQEPLYAASSLAGVTLAAAWGAALAWRSQQFFRMAFPALVYTFFVVVGVGILDHHDVIEITRYLYWIDPRKGDLLGFQSIFWNPGWFAWYFVMTFGLALGYLWRARGLERVVVGVLLAVAYVYFFRNPQRGGFVAVHVCLAIAGTILLVTSTNRVVFKRVLPLAGVALVAGVVTAYVFGFIPQELGSSLFRLVEAPAETATSNSVRGRLWSVAIDMWRDAPVFGIGEGSFAWRFEDYAAPGTARYSALHGDAHNTWLQLLATRGLVGAASLLLLVGVACRALVRARPAADRRDGLDRALAIGVCLSMAGFLIYSTVQAMFYLQSIQVLFWLLVAAAALLMDDTQRGVVRVPMPRWAIAAAGVAALVVQGIVAVPLFDRASNTIRRQPRGAYAVETSPSDPRAWRWTTGNATVCLAPRGPRMRVALATGDPRVEMYPRRVTLKIDGRQVESFTVADAAPVVRTLEVPVSQTALADGAFGECMNRPGELRLTLEVDCRWSPLGAGLGADPRTFGLQLFEPEYTENP